MNDTKMINEVAKRYARALFEISSVKKAQDRVFAELRVLVEAVNKDQSIVEFLSAQNVAGEHKAAVVDKALGGKAEQSLIDTLKIMSTKGRMNLLNDLLAAFEFYIDESHGVTRGTVRSAKVLSTEARKKIEDKVAAVTKKKVILNFKEDPKLLAGMVAQVGGWTFDDTLATHLTHMGEDLNRRAH